MKPGKTIAGKTYLHHSAIKCRPDLQTFVLAALQYLPINWDWNVVRVCPKTREIAFFQSPDFDSAFEPTVGPALIINSMGQIRKWSQSGFIYHHKHLFVASDYQGFDLSASIRRSSQWEKLNPDKSKIGRRSYWEKKVIPLLDSSQNP